MALKTLGTNANNTLRALVYQVNVAAADIATLKNNIKDDINVSHPLLSMNFDHAGLLYVPNRGVLKVLAGDYVAYDARGWPILVSNDAATGAGSSWTHS